MVNIKGEYTGTFIPAHIMLDDTLSPSEKMCFAIIASFDKCYMSNAAICKRLGTQERTVQKHIKALKDKGYIEQEDSANSTRVLVQTRTKRQGGGARFDVAATNELTPIDKNIEKKVDTLVQDRAADIALLEQMELNLKRRGKSRDYTRYFPKLQQRRKNFTDLEILAAATNIGNDTFMVTGNYNTLELLLRNDEKLDFWYNKSGGKEKRQFA